MMAALSGFGLACVLFGVIGGQSSQVWVGIGCVAVSVVVQVMRAARTVTDVATTVDALSRLRVGYDNSLDNANGAATAATAPRHGSQELAP